jgi:hypothetical protein
MGLKHLWGGSALGMMRGKGSWEAGLEMWHGVRDAVRLARRTHDSQHVHD